MVPATDATCNLTSHTPRNNIKIYIKSKKVFRLWKQPHLSWNRTQNPPVIRPWKKMAAGLRSSSLRTLWEALEMVKIQRQLEDALAEHIWTTKQTQNHAKSPDSKILWLPIDLSNLADIAWHTLWLKRIDKEKCMEQKTTWTSSNE